ncbi:MAG: nucleoside triphosphate pyrophosphohydrolase [Verrucomicrobium sp.]|nr:nucleoside triphosphate pyrophosphohydrolase [Verrucomicrobium sp.]
MPLPIPDSGLDPVQRLVQIMAALRGPDGCPWDREQTHATIRPHLVEECYEVLEAIDAGDPALLQEELGDLLLHVAFHAQMAAERGDFTFRDVAVGIAEKLIRRHPHVFGDAAAADSGEVLKHWQEIKRQEKPERAQEGALAGVPGHLPALMRAQAVQKKAAQVGFDWPDAEGPRAKIAEELEEIAAALRAGEARERVAEEVGDLLFAAVNFARHLKVDAETALRDASAKFEARFRGVEEAARAAGKAVGAMSLEEMEELWQRQK